MMKCASCWLGQRAGTKMNDAANVRELARPLAGNSDDYDELMSLVFDARVVLLGEASHGTHGT